MPYMMIIDCYNRNEYKPMASLWACALVGRKICDYNNVKQVTVIDNTTGEVLQIHTK